MQFLTAIKHFEIWIFLLFLLAIADLMIHPLSNNRSSQLAWSAVRSSCSNPSRFWAVLNSRLRELRIDYLIEDGWGPQWRPESAEIIISGNIYGRQEVHKYFCTSVNINGRFTWYIIPRLLHIKKMYGPTDSGSPKCQPSEDEPPDH